MEFEKITHCIITGLPISDVHIDHQHFSYRIQYKSGKIVSFNFCKRCFKQIDAGTKGKGHIVQGLILNNKITNIDEKIIHWDNEHDQDEISLKKEIEEGVYPKTPKEKFDHFFLWLFKVFKFGVFHPLSFLANDVDVASNYFENDEEMRVYFNAMKRDEFLSVEVANRYKISYEGLNYLIKNDDEGYTSNRCFVAMAFQDETKAIREAIRNALVKTGFEPIFIDEKHISSEKTINDEIISSLKKCKFCIADFTYHKNGVYFESGFALGQGKPVIYTCQAEEFKKAHFDIKPLQHIIYDDPKELEERLVHKIEAWIKN